MKAAFNIQAINNQFEVLALSLGIADDNDSERSKIVALGEQGGIHKFKYDGVLYSVARMELLPGVKPAIEYNSSWYAIQKTESSLKGVRSVTEQPIPPEDEARYMQIMGDYDAAMRDHFTGPVPMCHFKPMTFHSDDSNSGADGYQCDHCGHSESPEAAWAKVSGPQGKCQ